MDEHLPRLLALELPILACSANRRRCQSLKGGTRAALKAGVCTAPTDENNTHNDHPIDSLVAQDREGVRKGEAW